MPLYTPSFLVKFYRKRVKENPEKYKEIEEALEKSRYGITTARLLAIAQFYGMLAFIPGTLLGYLVTLLLLNLNVSLQFPYTLTINVPLPNIQLPSLNVTLSPVIIQLAISSIFGFIAYAFTKYLIASYPFYLANVRAGKIDAALPHAINMMLGMARGGIPLESIFKFLAENRQTFDELSVEFAKIVELVEMFGYELTQAIHYVAETTPSERLKSFLDNFVNIYEGAGNVLEFLKARSEHFMVERERYYGILFESLQIFAEVYLALFIVAPLFFLTVLTVFQLVGAGALETYRIILYTMIPFGSLMVIWLIRATIPREPKGVQERGRGVEMLEARINSNRRNGFEVNKFRFWLNKIKRFILAPVTEPLYSLTFRAISFHLLLPSVILFAFGYGKIELDILLFITLVTAIIPATLFVEYRKRTIEKMESELPEFLRQLATLNEAGLTVVETIKQVAEHEFGVLGREIKKIKREVEWGELVTSALQKVELRVKSPIFSRVISLVTKAVESTPTIKDALITASLYSEMELDARDRIKAQMNIYTIIIYLSFAVFLYTTYVLVNNMISVFSTISTSVPGVIATSIDIELLKRTFMETALLVGFFSGFTAGVMSEGKLIAGLKHVALFLVMTYAFFRFVLP
jgi:flagellar protein FlaJ